MKIEELKKLEAEATPADWSQTGNGQHVLSHGYGTVCLVFGDRPEPEWLANARLIAALRNAAPKLIAVVEAALEAKRTREASLDDPDFKASADVAWNDLCVVLAALEGDAHE